MLILYLCVFVYILTFLLLFSLIDYCKITLYAPDGTVLGSCVGGKTVEPTSPYLSAMDVEKELIVVANPLPQDVDLSNYFVQDINGTHRLCFPSGTILPASSHLFVYSCPGGDKNESRTYREPYVLWRNQDGSLRRKEVLNNRKTHRVSFSS